MDFWMFTFLSGMDGRMEMLCGMMIPLNPQKTVKDIAVVSLPVPMSIIPEIEGILENVYVTELSPIVVPMTSTGTGSSLAPLCTLKIQFPVAGRHEWHHYIK
mmetsp:Transcript_33088/g.79947  ORF Transcript_33088/g.79947 Transcript_33088/m.79947 type:complete len:102 (+) Transcript_33088:541-846(+)